jgi:ABC-type transport system substrate-binding protein
VSGPPPDISDLATELVSLFPMLGELEPIRVATGGSGDLSPTAESQSPGNRNQIFELLARTLTRLAGGKPLVLVLEDLHGAEVSLEALQYIVRRLGPTPTLVVAAYRSTGIDRRHPLSKMLQGFRGDRNFSSLTLEPLAASEHREFLSTLIGGSDVEDSFADKLYEASEGNPFFTKELVRSLLDSESIVQDNTGAWALSGGIEISSETMAGDDVDEAVDRLVQEGLVEEERQSRGDRLTFSSGVVRDVLYAQLSRRRRRSLHRRYAKLLEKRNRGRLEGVYPQLVHHYAEGDEPEKTVEFGLLHATKALSTFSAEDAMRSARTALEFLDKEWEGERSIEGEARMLLAAGHRMAGELNAALRETEAAIKIFEKERQAERSVDALLEAARAAWQFRRTEETRRWVEQGMQAARDAGKTEELGQFLSLAATLANLRGEYGQANEYLQEAERVRPDEVAGDADEEIPRGGRLVVPIANPVTATMPSQSQFVEEGEIFRNVHETLLVTDEQGTLGPLLCEKWAARDEGRAFLLTLRSGVRFHDGHPLDAASVKQSFETASRHTAASLPAALSAIEGAAECASGKADEISGIIVHGDQQLEIRLTEAVPVYPAFLTDDHTSIMRRPSETGAPYLGTGPFRWVSRDDRRLIVEHNPDYWGEPSRLDAIEFRIGLTTSEIAAGFRSGEFDLGRDLQLDDLDGILRDTRLPARLVEAPRKFSYFVLFNTLRGPHGVNATVRKALAGVVQPYELVWQSLGRFAQPAAGFLPPGILGHDPGKRRSSLSLDEARELLRAEGLGDGVQLQAIVHPLLQDRYEPLLRALFEVWRELGVEISVAAPDMKSFLAAFKDNAGIDLYIGRFGPDYDDPDYFTYAIFRSQGGELSAYFCSEEADRIMDEARMANRSAVREGLYRKFENLLCESAAMIPLFFDIDYRIVGPRVRGPRLSSVVPYVNYRSIGKTEEVAAPEESARAGSGVLRIPMTGHVDRVDPIYVETVEAHETLASVFETLTRGVGEAQIVPWLAASLDVENGGKRYRFRLRKDVRFHDGRRLTARDVRYSFERMLKDPDCRQRALYSPIRGAKALMQGDVDALSGLQIDSASEFCIELEQPVSFFPALISHPTAAIVPEGTVRCGRSWQDGAVGTGPFRLVSFVPEERLELERNPTYWRSGEPASQELIFNFGIAPEDILAGVRSGRFSLAADLRPSDVEVLRREAGFADAYREAPRLSTYFAVFNIHRGPLSDRALRQRLAHVVNVAPLVRETLGQLAIPAHGLIPPGLLGHEPLRDPGSAVASDKPSSKVELKAAIHPVYSAEYAALANRLGQAFHEAGVKIVPQTETLEQALDAVRRGEVDLAVSRWIADFPDADTFVSILHKDGLYGRMCGMPEIDTLYDRGRIEQSPAVRHSVYRRIEEIAARECIVLPLFHEQVYRFARPEVEGLSVSYQSPAVAYEKLRVRT